MQRLTQLGIIAGACLPLFATLAPGAVVTAKADFTDGTGTTSSDQYTGKSGDGWAGAWTNLSSTVSGFSATASVSSTTPLTTGGGNYLTVSSSATNTTAVGLTSVIRQLNKTTGTVDYTKDHTISWTIRIDDRGDGTSNNFDHFNDKVEIFDKATGTINTGSDSSWSIRGVGLKPNWVLISGTSATGNLTMETATSVPIVVGNVYTMSVTVHPNAVPANATWDATVTNLNTNATDTKTGLLFRGDNLTTTGGFLQFLTQTETTTPTETHAFSIDSVSVTQAPEPAGASLLLGCAAFLRRRRTQ